MTKIAFIAPLSLPIFVDYISIILSLCVQVIKRLIRGCFFLPSIYYKLHVVGILRYFANKVKYSAFYLIYGMICNQFKYKSDKVKKKFTFKWWFPKVNTIFCWCSEGRLRPSICKTMSKIKILRTDYFSFLKLKDLSFNGEKY